MTSESADISADLNERTPEDIERLRRWYAYCADPTGPARAAYFDYQDEWRASRGTNAEATPSDYRRTT